MTNDLIRYHNQRAEHCRSLADQAIDPEIRRRHEQLAALHADHASRYAGANEAAAGLSAA